MQQQTAGMYTAEMSVPSILYKILSLSDWENSQGRDRLVTPLSDSPFIHFSMKQQVEGVLKKKFNDTPYVVLKVDTTQLVGTMVLEWNSKGTEQYYHLYDGFIPTSAVTVDATFSK